MVATMLPAESMAAETTAVQTLPAERRLAESRAEIETLLMPHAEEFPRSHTMRFLMGGNGKVAAIGAFAALLAFKPRLALALIRFLPIGGIARRML